MAAYMTASFNNTPISMFLQEVKADPWLNWNHEPEWVYALMNAYPNSLVIAKKTFLEQYAKDPDIYEAMQEAEPVGGE